MLRVDVIKLVSDSPTAHGVHDTPTQTEREVMAEIASVGMTEAYTMLSQGLNPSYRFILALADDYQNERELIFNNERYRIVRTYMAGDGIEITAERVSNDV